MSKKKESNPNIYESMTIDELFIALHEYKEMMRRRYLDSINNK